MYIQASSVKDSRVSVKPINKYHTFRVFIKANLVKEDYPCLKKFIKKNLDEEGLALQDDFLKAITEARVKLGY